MLAVVGGCRGPLALGRLLRLLRLRLRPLAPLLLLRLLPNAPLRISRIISLRLRCPALRLISLRCGCGAPRLRRPALLRISLWLRRCSVAVFVLRGEGPSLSCPVGAAGVRVGGGLLELLASQAQLGNLEVLVGDLQLVILLGELRPAPAGQRPPLALRLVW